MSLDFGNTYLLDQESGHALSAKHQRVAELIHDFNSELELRWIPTGQRTAFDKEPFAVYHVTQGSEYMVVSCKEEEVDHRLIARLFSMDNANGSVLDKIESEEAAKRALKMKEQIDSWEEAHELAGAIVGTRKSVYRHNGVEYRS